MRKLLLSTALLAAALFSNGAQANLMLQATPGGGNAGTDNILFNNCTAPNITVGTTVQGCLNQSRSTLVNFTGIETLVADGGQARVQAQTGNFDQVTISLANSTLGFDTLLFNVDTVVSGAANISAVDQFGTMFNFGSFFLDGGGENKFRLGSVDGQVAVSLFINSSVAIDNISSLEQVRLGLATRTPNVVPEPASLALLGAGLLGLGTIRRRR